MLAGIVVSNTARGTDVFLLRVLCVVRVKVYATGQSLVQRSSTECGVPDSNLETSRIRSTWPEFGHRKIKCTFIQATWGITYNEIYFVIM